MTVIYNGAIEVLERDENGLITMIRIPRNGLPDLPCKPSTAAEIEALFPHLASHGTTPEAITPLETQP